MIDQYTTNGAASSFGEGVVTAYDPRYGTEYKLRPMTPNQWRVLGILRGSPRTPVPYEQLAAAIGQDPSAPVHGPKFSASGSRVYQCVYSIRIHFKQHQLTHRIIRLKPWDGAPQGGYMFLPGDYR